MKNIFTLFLAFATVITVCGQNVTSKTVIVTKYYKTVPQGKKWILKTGVVTKIQVNDGVLNSGSMCNALFLSNPRIIMNICRGTIFKSEGYGIIFKDPVKVPYTNNYTYEITPISFIDKNFSTSELKNKNPEDVGTKNIVFYAGESVFVASCLETIEMIEINMTAQELLDEKKKKNEEEKSELTKEKNFSIPINPEKYVAPGTKPIIKDSLIKYVVFESPEVVFHSRTQKGGLDDVHHWTLTLTRTSFEMKSSGIDETYTVLGAKYDDQLHFQEFQLGGETGQFTHKLNICYSNSSQSYMVLFSSIDHKDDYQFQQITLKEIYHKNDSIKKVKNENELIDQKIYKSVKIGTQEWMSENLNVTTFQNGDTIPYCNTEDKWKNAQKTGMPAWCYYGLDAINGIKYGKLYNWYAVHDPRGLAPKDWHIPNDQEWTTLINYLGGEEIAGKKMKSISEWENDPGGSQAGDNESGFSALPAGTMNPYTFEIGKFCAFWSSTECSYNAHCNNLNSTSSEVIRISSEGMTNMLSVRCVKGSEKKIAFINNSQNGISKSVKIGEQEWTVENLSVSTFRNGDTITEAHTAEEWETANKEGKPAWCYYDNSSNYGTHYGRLYNWYAVNDKRGLAPNGWHIPTSSEWKKLINYLGNDAGSKMKSKLGWQGGNSDQNNTSGFTALPGGYCESNGHFSLLGNGGFFWLSGSVKECSLGCNSSEAGFSSGRSKEEGLSVRCVKD